MSDDLELLRRVRARLDKPERWIKGWYAATGKGRPIGPLEANAVCWCTLGAARAEGCGDGGQSIARALGFYGVMPLADWNDAPERTHADILARLDAAIARLEGGAA